MRGDLRSEPVDLHFAQKRRKYLPDEYFDDLALVEVSIDHGRWPEVPHIKGGKAAGRRSIPRIRAAILEELRKLLCTNDPIFNAVRIKGHAVSQAAVAAIAGYIAKAFGLALGFATGAVAFLALLVLKVGVGVFCTLNPPPEEGINVSPTPVKTPKKQRKKA